MYSFALFLIPPLLYWLLIPSDPVGSPEDRYVSGNNTDEVTAVQYLRYLDEVLVQMCNLQTNLLWNYVSNTTEENKQKMLEQSDLSSKVAEEVQRNITSFAWRQFNDPFLRRKFERYSLQLKENPLLPGDKLSELNEIQKDMEHIYENTAVCSYHDNNDCNLHLDPDLVNIMQKSRDYNELLHVWKSWRDKIGVAVKNKYARLVELSNEGAINNGFENTGDEWREVYESERFQEEMKKLWGQVYPLYEQLHAYVRRKLINIYGSDKIRSDGPIPAHLLGDMWGQYWIYIENDTIPFPNKPSFNITPKMLAMNLTPPDLFRMADELFTSLGLKPASNEFWNNSIFERPSDREILCQPTAWDFCDGKDYRILMCANVDMDDFVVVHELMGNLQYRRQFASQPMAFREGANPGFEVAIGDALALSVFNPKHLKAIGLMDEISEDNESKINFLYAMALKKVAFLPFGYLIDLWRWSVFSGDVRRTRWNTKWWELRLKYQGLCPPVTRTDNDCDPTSIYHVPANVPYIKFFVSYILQFQIHKYLCAAAGHTGPLHECDISNSEEAGRLLRQSLELGSSKPFREVMKILTNGDTENVDAAAMLEYFEPLYDWLKEKNISLTLNSSVLLKNK